MDPTLPCMVSAPKGRTGKQTDTRSAEMKLIVTAIYSNYTSHIVDDDGMENQSDGYTGRPENERLFLRFQPAV